MGLAMGRGDKRGYVLQLVEYVLLLLAIIETHAPSAVAQAAARTKATKGAKKILETDIDYRLPTSVYPIFYQIRLQPNMTNPKKLTFWGEVKIQIICKEETNKITLHASGLNINRSSIVINPGEEDIRYVGHKWEKKKDFFTINLNKRLQPDVTYWISMNYTALLKSEPVGLYYVKYYRNGETKYMVRTKFEPTYARRAFPCFDEPALKAIFQIDLVKPADTTSVSNMPIENDDNTINENGTVYNIDSYKLTRNMSTYLVAFVFFDFKAHTTETKTTKSLTMLTCPKLVEKSAQNLELGVKLFDYFKRLFKPDWIAERNPMLRMVAVPEQDRKASHDLGLITFREAYLMGNESNEVLKFHVKTTIARAFAHQFVGNLVTPEWWNDLWINEGLASFMEQSAIAALNTDVNMHEFFIMDKLYPAFALDGSVHSRPLYTRVSSPDTIKIMLGGIAVYKGAAIFRMIESFLGAERLRNAISVYVENLEGKIVNHNLFYIFLQQRGKLPIDLKEFLDTWVLQTNYPVVMVARDVNDHTCIQVTQERFLDHDTDEDDDRFKSPFNYRWSIPLTFFSKESIRDNKAMKVYWLYKNEYTKIFKFDDPLPASERKDGWILANYKQKGYYRVNYPHYNWVALGSQLSEDHTRIPVINRAQIINDAWNLAKAGYAQPETGFEVVGYLSKETDYLPWFAAMKEFKYVAAMLEGTSQGEKFRVYVQQRLKGLYDKFGYGVQETYFPQLMQSLAVLEGCNFGIEPCNKYTSTEFKTWMSNNGEYNIKQNLRPAVYCRGVANEENDQHKHWDFVFKKYSETDDEDEKEHLLYALSCSNNDTHMHLIGAAILKRLSIFPESSAFKILTLMINKLVYKDAGWTFYYKNYKQLKDKFASFGCKYALLDLTKNLNTDADLSAVTTFMKRYCEDYDETTYPLEIIDNIKKNIKWRNKILPIIDEKLNLAS